jgi:hypothetical protein
MEPHKTIKGTLQNMAVATTGWATEGYGMPDPAAEVGAGGPNYLAAPPGTVAKRISPGTEGTRSAPNRCNTL